MAQSAQQVLQQLAQGTYATVYFLQGEESYYIDEIAQYLENKVLTEAEKGFNLTISYGKECSMAALLTQARRFPMGADKQVVIVKEAQEMADLKNNIGQKLLLHYLQRPQPTTLLLFVHKYKTIDGRTAFSKKLAQQAVLVTARKLYDRQLPAFIKSHVDVLERTITPEAIGMLQLCMSNDLTRIASELNKLCLNLPQGGAITPEMVETYVGVHKSFNVFELQQAVMQKDYSKSYEIMRTCMSNSREYAALPIVGLLYHFFSRLLMLYQTKETAPTKIAQQLDINPYFIQGYLDAAKRYTFKQALKNLTYLYHADLQLKGVNCQLSDYAIMQLLIFQLMHEVSE